MRAPKLKDLNKAEKNDSFTKAVQVVQAQQEEMIKKTFTLDRKTIDIINETALKLGQERGKVISASEAVRIIISQFGGIK